MPLSIGLGVYLGATGIPGPPSAPNNYWGMIGASSVAAGGNLTGLCQFVSGTNVGGFHPWTVYESDGALCYGGAAATGGFTIQQAIDTHLQTMLDAEPERGIVGISAGTNDKDAIAPAGVLSQSALDTRVDYIETEFVQPVIAAGRLPVIFAPQPNNTVQGLVAMPALSSALEDLAARYGIPFVSMFDVLGNAGTGDWTDVGADSSDSGTHLSSVGAQKVGAAAAAILADYANPSHTPDMVVTGDASAGFAWLGGLFDSDGNANNRPDGGGASLVTDNWSAPSNTASATLAAATHGNWFGVNKTGTAGSSSTSATGTTAPSAIAVNEGDSYELAFKIKTNFASATSGPALKLSDVSVGSSYLTYVSGGAGTNYVLTGNTMWVLGDVPAGTTLLKWTYGWEVAAGNADVGKVEISQLSLKLVEGTMAATGTMAWYGKALDAMRRGTLELDAGTFKVMGANSSYTPNPDSDDFRNDVDAYEVTGTGWSSGGVAVTVTLDQDTANNRLRVFATDVSESTVTVSDFKHAILYKSLGGASSADPLIGYVTFDTALSATAGPISIDFDGTNGALREAY